MDERPSVGPPGLDDASDALVAARAADGDARAFAVLVHRYTPMMRAYARRVLNATDEVDDVVQDAFITAWQRLPELAEPGKVKSWLMRITSRNAVDRLRRRRPQTPIEDHEHELVEPRAPETITESRSQVAALDEALRALPDAQRECWVLRELGGYSYDEIAEELGIPASTVRGLLARARKHLIVRMEAWR